MTNTVFYSQSAWQAQENNNFDTVMDKMDTYNTAGQQLMFLQVVFSFMSNYYGGETEWQSYGMNDLSNVELYDMQWIENSYQQVTSDGINGAPTNNDYLITQQAYGAANNMLQDLYTNPMFEGTQLPEESLNNLVTIFGLQSSDVSYHLVTVTIDGNPTTVQNVPYFDTSYNAQDLQNDTSALVVKTTNFWGEASTFAPGDQGYTKYVDQMQVVQQTIQQTTSLYTDKSSTLQSTEKYVYGAQKMILGIWENLNKNTTSMQQTVIQAETRS